MSEIFTVEGSRLVRRCEGETLIIEAWGANSLRVRALRMGQQPSEDHWALLEGRKDTDFSAQVEGRSAQVRNGTLTLRINEYGKLSFYRTGGELLFEEFLRTRRNLFSEDCSALELESREFKPLPGGDYALTVRFSANEGEKLYGMGQYQQPILDLKGCYLELAQRNSQASVPFVLSNRGYGFLWNNPAVGSVTFGKNLTQWEARSTKQLDYWVTAGDTPRQIEAQYAEVTGKVPMMPEYGLGFWQCKLRYQTQEELLRIARRYHELGQKVDMIIVDFFHWEHQGDWAFDPTYWPDPEGMIRELKQMGTELMVSVWPTVETDSVNYAEMEEKGYLVRTERGFPCMLHFLCPTMPYDATNPDARAYLWEKCRKNYYEKGVQSFWLDVAEPECTVYDFDNYRYHQGSALQVGNLYPMQYARTFYEGMRAAGQEQVVNLIRCAWAGSQRYGALVWSGDIHSSFSSMRSQLAAGLNMGLAGIPWWTSDIGGFHGGIPEDPSFRELLARWFAWGAFCPVMRLHGNREPEQPMVGTTGGCHCRSGAPNEIWSFGEEVFAICRKYLDLRERMRDYTRSLMRQAHETGTPVMRTMFFEFPEDPQCWELEDQYMFGPDLLVAPVLYEHQTQRRVYLPEGSWVEHETGRIYPGRQWVTVSTPLDQIPLFRKDGARVFL